MISWDEYFFRLCETIALRSKDEDTKPGCVIVNKYNIIQSTGYNSLPAGVLDEEWPKNRTDKQYAIKNKSTGDTSIIDMTDDYILIAVYDKIGEVTKYDVMVHAEANAIVSAGKDLHGCTLYCTYYPCHECAKLIINSGIKVVKYQRLNPRFELSYAITRQLFAEARIECEEVK